MEGGAASAHGTVRGCSLFLGLHYPGLLQEPSLEGLSLPPSLERGLAGRSVREAAQSVWVRQVPCAGAPSGLGSGGPMGMCQPLSRAVSPSQAAKWDCHVSPVMRRSRALGSQLCNDAISRLASCPPKFQEDFSATANTGQSLPDKNIGLTSCPWCPPSTSAHQESAMAEEYH